MYIFGKISSRDPRDDSIKDKIFYRRNFVLNAVKAFVFGVIVVRLMHLQLFEHTKYKEMSDRNRYRFGFIFGKRGLIKDRNNRVLVGNIMYRKVILDTKQFDKLGQTVDFLVTLMDTPPKSIEAYKKKMQSDIKKNPHDPLVLWKYLSDNEIARIEFNSLKLPGVEVIDDMSRKYSLGSHAFHVLGYIALMTKERILDELTKKLSRASNYYIGQLGIEKSMNSELAGEFGISLTEVDAAGTVVDRATHTTPTDGHDVRLTIDSVLQNQAGELLDGKEGCITMIDIKTGNILAMASTPSTDPNTLAKGFDADSWKEITNSKTMFINKNTSIPYPPGSTFKIVSALCGLEHGLDPAKIFICTGQYKFGNRIFHCHKEHGHGPVNLTTAIAYSCNCYFYNLGSNLKIKDLSDTALMCGFGHIFDIELPQVAGIVPSEEWKMARLGQVWSRGETLNTTIGQGFLEVTPLQMAVMMARLASKKMVSPRLITSVDDKLVNDKEADDIPAINISPENIDIVLKGLQGVFDIQGGTCYYRRVSDPKYQIAGKTGTAQVLSQRFKSADLRSGKIKYENIPHGLFVGYAPATNPLFAISIVVEHGIGGTSSCVPLAKQILKTGIDIYHNTYKNDDAPNKHKAEYISENVPASADDESVDAPTEA